MDSNGTPMYMPVAPANYGGGFGDGFGSGWWIILLFLFAGGGFGWGNGFGGNGGDSYARGRSRTTGRYISRDGGYSGYDSRDPEGYMSGRRY